MRRSVIALATALLVLSGCGNEEPKDPDPTPTKTTTEPTSSPTPSATPTVVAPADLVVSLGAVGPARAGMSKDEALKTGLFDADVPPPVEGCDPFPLQWKERYKGVDVLTGEDGSIISLGAFEGGPRTAQGIGYGSTLADVTKAYPNLSPVVDAGFGQAGAYEFTDDEFIGFLFGDATVSSIEQSSKVTFMEVSIDEKPKLMRSGC
ncbi:MAG: hypothetical protein ACR2FE_04590 [Aeromicrobium sp.]